MKKFLAILLTLVMVLALCPMSAFAAEEDDFYLEIKFSNVFQPTEWNYKASEKLAAMIKVYLTNGGKHVQFNVVDRAEMEDAKVNPEDHSELVVRVAGYSALFTTLSRSLQDDIIARTEQGGF